MISAVDTARMTTGQRSAAIYSSAKSELAGRLWRAALGNDHNDDAPTAATAFPEASTAQRSELFDLLRATRVPAPNPLSVDPEVPAAPVVESAIGSPAGLGANARYGPTLATAAARVDLPTATLTAIVNAEAAKSPDGSWQTYSRNPRSTAAGLGQFLSGTWETMASTAGTWLNGIAQAKGWLSAAGSVLPAARSALLALRYDGEASISTIADYARHNLDAFKRAGVPIGDSAESVAQLAYVGHQLGLGDGIRFLKDGLDPHRARLLLNAQVGVASAGQRIEQAGGAAAAHRAWLLEFISRRLHA